ncbi:MAG: RluA family pseudouridine synthase [Oscillospiraceae bacterium]|nr:RluA family pseudouridine synthase [Candidatus Ruminococcus equi]
MDKKIISFTVPCEFNGKMLKVFLKKYCNMSTRTLSKLKREDCGITRDNAVIKATDNVFANEKIVISLPKDKNEIIPIKGDLDILFEDEYLLCINKPYNMPVHPTKVHQTDTLSNIVSYYMVSNGENYAFRAVNRLDKDTSGIVILAKDRYTCAVMQGSNEIQKEYVAVCEGEIFENITIDNPISLAENSKIKRCVCDNGQKAITHCTPIKNKNDHTLLKVTLETGRTHQIRCHLSSIGHPLAGDDLYGGSREKILRQALHCISVTFLHPITKRKVIIKTDIPQEFLAIVK